VGDVLHNRDGALAHERDRHEWERTPWHATQRAAWEALMKSNPRKSRCPASRRD